jgi:hypothetical protein
MLRSVNGVSRSLASSSGLGLADADSAVAEVVGDERVLQAVGRVGGVGEVLVDTVAPAVDLAGQRQVDAAEIEAAVVFLGAAVEAAALVRQDAGVVELDASAERADEVAIVRGDDDAAEGFRAVRERRAAEAGAGQCGQGTIKNPLLHFLLPFWIDGEVTPLPRSGAMCRWPRRENLPGVLILEKEYNQIMLFPYRIRHLRHQPGRGRISLEFSATARVQEPACPES